MIEYLMATNGVQEWDVWACAAILVEWIDQELLRVAHARGLLEDDFTSREVARVFAERSNKNGSEDSTVDVMLMQIVGYLNYKVKATSKCLEGMSDDSAVLAALYFMEGQGLVVTGLINEVDKHHWHLSPVAYKMMRLTFFDVSASEVATLSSTMGLAMIKESDHWREGKEVFFGEYYAVASKINLLDAWRDLGTSMIFWAKKYISFAGHEEAGGWLFTVTRKGEKFGLKRTSPGEAMLCSLVPFTHNKGTMMASAQELEPVAENHVVHS
jgi:hypothetical protein